VGEDAKRDTRRRLTVAEAAGVLGVTVDAIRSRVKRGTIAHVREGGRVYVLLGADQGRPGHDQPPDQGGDQDAPPGEDRTAELIATLREQLSEERQAHAEARRLLMAALERIPPQLEAPRESPQTAAEASEGAQPHPGTEASQEGVQRPQGGTLRSLRRRLLGW
jgi:excisionase family DNA binding protein